MIAWSAATGGVSGEMVRDLMVACVERRFGVTRAPHLVEWLSDNGSAYIAKETAHTAAALGLRLAFTPVRSPESNGVAEAFVTTLRREDAPLAILPDAETAIGLLPGWIEHYNTLWTPPAASWMSAWSAVDATIYPACCGGDHALGHDEDPLLFAS